MAVRLRINPDNLAQLAQIITAVKPIPKLERLQGMRDTLVFYESPYRIEKLLGELNEVFTGRQVVLARELTKKFEEYLRGTPAELLAAVRQRPLKGEFVVLAGNA